MNLETVAQTVRDQFPSGTWSDLDRRERRIEKFGNLAVAGLMCVFVLTVLGLVYAIFDRMVFSGNNPAVGFLLIGIVIFGLLTLMYVFLREDLKAKRKQAGANSQMPGELQMPLVTGRLIEEREFNPVPAVTEETTDLLPATKRETPR